MKTITYYLYLYNIHTIIGNVEEKDSQRLNQDRHTHTHTQTKKMKIKQIRMWNVGMDELA